MFQGSNFTRSASRRRRAVAAVAVASATVLLGGGPAAAAPDTSGTLTHSVLGGNPGHLTGVTTGTQISGGFCLTNKSVRHETSFPNGVVTVKTSGPTGTYRGPVTSHLVQDSAVFYTKLANNLIQNDFYTDDTCSVTTTGPIFKSEISGVNQHGDQLTCEPKLGNAMTRAASTATVTVTDATCKIIEGASPLSVVDDQEDPSTSISHSFGLIGTLVTPFSVCAAPFGVVAECLTSGTIVFS